jgi:hypothetical protein
VNTRIEPEETLDNEKFPSKSDTVPLEVFLTTILTPGSGMLSTLDLTVPEAENVCEKTNEAHKKVSKKE